MALQYRTREQEQRYTMALGYAWGRKDGTSYGSDSAVRTLATSSLDFAMWYATDTTTPLDSAWEAFSNLTPKSQRELAQKYTTLPWVARPTHTDITYACCESSIGPKCAHRV